MTERPAGKSAESPSVAELVNAATEQMRRLVRDEMRLATLELQRKGKRLGIGAGLAGAAGLLAFYGGATVIAAGVLALATVLPGWAAALIVGAVLLLAAAVAGLAGKKQVQQAVPPVPEEATRSVKQDIDVIKEGTQR